MKQGKVFFKLYKQNGFNGYHFPVRNTFSNRIDQEFIPVEARKLFEKKFGQTIISDEEFLDWYTENAKNFYSV